MTTKRLSSVKAAPADARETARTIIFVSHANPQDNEFALWLTLQLANAGYAVWCDLTKLLGGEKFWEDIQATIRQSTVKFVFVLSRDANEKRGTLDELDAAIGTEKRIHAKDFIITAKIDDLPYDDIYIGIRRLNHINFTKSWARGLALLLEKLETDNVAKTSAFNPDAVCSWWRDQFSATAGVLDTPENVFSNWFKVEHIPSMLYEHQLQAIRPGPVGIEETTFPYPAVWITDTSFLSFAKADDFANSLGSNLEIKTKDHTYEDVVAGKNIKEGPKHIAQLLRIAWEQSMGVRLPCYELGNKYQCFYFPGGRVKDDSVDFTMPDGQKRWRGLVGYKTLPRERKRYWHYGVSGKPVIRPETLFVVKGHVVFSDDRQTLWTNKDAMAKARRNQCRNWWNDDWRDRMLATMSFLADSQESVMFSVGKDVSFTLSRFPIPFASPVSYIPPADVEKPEFDDYSFEDDEDDEDTGGAVPEEENQ